jgi:hypothetical protein
MRQGLPLFHIVYLIAFDDVSICLWQQATLRDDDDDCANVHFGVVVYRCITSRSCHMLSEH